MKDEGIFSKSWIPGAMALPASAGKVKRITGAPPGYAYGSPAAAAGFGADGLGAKVTNMRDPRAKRDPTIQRHAVVIAGVIGNELKRGWSSAAVHNALRVFGTTQRIYESMRAGYGPYDGYSALRSLIHNHLMPAATAIYPHPTAWTSLSVLISSRLETFYNEAAAQIGLAGRKQLHG